MVKILFHMALLGVRHVGVLGSPMGRGARIKVRRAGGWEVLVIPPALRRTLATPWGGSPPLRAPVSSPGHLPAPRRLVFFAPPSTLVAGGGDPPRQGPRPGRMAFVVHRLPWWKRLRPFPSHGCGGGIGEQRTRVGENSLKKAWRVGGLPGSIPRGVGPSVPRSRPEDHPKTPRGSFFGGSRGPPSRPCRNSPWLGRSPRGNSEVGFLPYGLA